MKNLSEEEVIKNGLSIIRRNSNYTNHQQIMPHLTFEQKCCWINIQLGRFGWRLFNTKELELALKRDRRTIKKIINKMMRDRLIT